MSKKNKSERKKKKTFMKTWSIKSICVFIKETNYFDLDFGT